MAKLMDYTEDTRFDTGDILIKDGINGTRKIKASNAAAEFAGLLSPDQHRNVYRGKNLGTQITEDQRYEIGHGTFDDIFIGDYWVINDRKYVVADMDYWYKTGGNAAGTTDPCNLHHLVMIQERGGAACVMNETAVTDGGYLGSYFYSKLKSGDNGYDRFIKTDFGDKLMTHKEYLINAVTNGRPSGAIWVDSETELLSEIMLFGCRINQPSNTGDNNLVLGTVDNQQLALFRMKPDYIDRLGQGIWLRDVASSTRFCSVTPDGRATSNSADATRSPLLVFAIA